MALKRAFGSVWEWYCGLKVVLSSTGKLPKDSPKVARFTCDFVIVLPHLGDHFRRRLVVSNRPGPRHEFLKLGMDLGQTSVGEYVVRFRKAPNQILRTFPDNRPSPDPSFQCHRPSHHRVDRPVTMRALVFI